jgi:hypothetical protein
MEEMFGFSPGNMRGLGRPAGSWAIASVREGLSMPRAALGLTVLVVVFGAVVPVSAQAPRAATEAPIVLSTSLPPEPPSSTNPQPEALGGTPVTNLPPVLGTPVLPAERGTNVPGTSPVIPDTSAPRKRGAVLALSGNEGTPASYQAVEPDVNPPPPVDANDWLRSRSPQRDAPPPVGPRQEQSTNNFGGEFGDKLCQLLGKPNEWFKSDHAFDGFISPVTNPFLFEDPRSLTEVRPIFAIEKIPNSEPDFRGGNTFFFGTQLRLAITDRLSFTINKFGLESFNPGSGSEFKGDTGFAEFWFGPKYTFIRNETTGTLLAGGLQFQIPTGNHQNFQDTGSLSLVPYVSYAQNFGRDLSFGSFNGMVGTGYSFSVNNERSDYFYLSAHIDLNVLNQNHWFPLLEMNWFTYTTNGRSTPIGIEGQDLINFGGQARGQGLLTGAIGLRYAFNEHYQVGGAFEIPFAGPHDLMDYRFTLDFIFRY